MTSLVQSLGAVVDAAGFTGADHNKLIALVQSQSGGIVDMLEDLKEKAEAELAEARKTESQAAHNFNLMSQSLKDQIAADTKDLTEEKSAKESASEQKATAEGDLSST